MAPVTRTRSKALDKATTSNEDERAKSTAGAEAGATQQDESLGEPLSPNTERRRLAVRTRDENENENETETESEKGKSKSKSKNKNKNKKNPRSSSVSVADSQDDDVTEFEPRSASKQLLEEANQRLAAEPAPQGSKEGGKSKHVVFGNDDDVDKYVAAAAETSRLAPEAAAAAEDDDEDSDEAPEAVSTKVSAKATLDSAKALADSTEKQATLLKRKRKERDNLFKEQAAQKRKRVSKTKTTAGPEADAEAEVDGEVTATAGRRRAEKVKLPSVLPAEFLTDSSSESEDEEDEAALRRMVKRSNKKINFEDKDKAPRDQVVGSTVYRVVASPGDKKLAPKMHKHARNAKEDLLRRKRAAVAPSTRKGFFARK